MRRLGGYKLIGLEALGKKLGSVKPRVLVERQDDGPVACLTS